MTARIIGELNWEGGISDDGHHDYFVDWLIECAIEDGPQVALNCPGLPSIGAAWIFGNDNDPYAFCHPAWRATPAYSREPGDYFVVSQPFSTRPMRRCQDDQIENPLSEPPRLSGSFVKFMREAQVDRFGKALLTTSHERIRGAAVEFDANNATVQVGLNSMNLGANLWSPMIDIVNDAPLWGLPKRTIKLSNTSWTRLVYGTCSFYYDIQYDFDINFRTHDRIVASEGTRCLIGWMPGSSHPEMDPDGIDPDTGEANYKNPNNFEIYKDHNGENARCFLDLKGRPVFDEDDIHYITIEKFNENNLLLLGVPASF